MSRRTRAEPPSGYVVMLVDDNPDYLQATRVLLARDGHEMLTATNGREALDLLRTRSVDLLLLDYYMPGMTGAEVVSELRRFDPHVQVILQTGYSSEQPPQELLRRLDIQGYYDKTEGPEQLLMWAAVGLKAAHTVRTLHRTRDGLQQILKITPELHRTKSLPELLATALRVATGLVACGTSQPEVYIELFDQPGASRADVTTVPLNVGDVRVGVLCLRGASVAESTLDLLRLLADQIAVAVQNVRKGG
jgi:CheY-like chemotaxis protein